MFPNRGLVVTALVVNAVLWLLAAFSMLAGIVFYAAGTGGVVTLDFTLFGELWLEVMLIYAVTPLVSVGVAHLLAGYEPG
ncbi:hypothetical protein [Halorarius halobius]|uniref:hypothetical protein n=1 Tax=Halorarius halobius TaxID=2962671 RepID=UPI0020CB761A|nr:hypothetical protein [Halorarius halobius]